MDEAELIAGLRAGGTAALAGLFHRHGDEVYRLAWRMLRSRADAEDVVQEVFLGLPRAVHGFRGDCAFSGWLRRVTVRVALMRLRSARRRREDPEARMADAVASTRSDSILERLDLDRALEQVGDGLRTVFLLKVVEGFSHDEIAALLGITELASRRRLARARAELRRLLG